MYSTVEYARRRKNIEDDDNGTVRRHLSNLNCTNEQYIDLSINNRHRVYCCITFVLVFALYYIQLFPPISTLSIFIPE